MLLIRVKFPIDGSIGEEIPIGAIVKFVKTVKPNSVAWCNYHGKNSGLCRYICVEHNELIVQTNVCMEDAAKYYFELI